MHSIGKYKIGKYILYSWYITGTRGILSDRNFLNQSYRGGYHSRYIKAHLGLPRCGMIAAITRFILALSDMHMCKTWPHLANTNKLVKKVLL